MKLGRNARLAGFESEYATGRCEAQVVQRLHGPRLSRADRDPDEVRVRVAGRTDSLEAALRICWRPSDKSTVAEKAVTVTLSVLTELLTAIMRGALGPG